MRIVISPRAEKQLKKVTKVQQIFIAKKIRSLGELRISAEEKLAGYTAVYRVRVGDYRIVYKKTKDEIYVILIGHRKEIYDLLKRLLN